jgi:hypothetical protein
VAAIEEHFSLPLFDPRPMPPSLFGFDGSDEEDTLPRATTEDGSSPAAKPSMKASPCTRCSNA